ncbi:MAG TPA: hypothetical protein VIQ74_10260 [Gemmatimonadaceae bacterium]|jgi:hypothetical protein
MNRIRLVVAALATSVLIPIVAGAQATTSDSSKTPPPEPAKPAAPRLDFSGVVFGNFQVVTDSATREQHGGKATDKFDIERAYLNFRMPAGDRASVRVTTDIKQQNATGGAYGGWIVRLKYAYLQYDFLRNSGSPDGASAFARVGVLNNVVIDHEESFWPRYLSKVGPDRYGYFSSSDLGFATQLTLPKKLGEIYGTITNGNGYESPESDRFKDFALRVSLTPLGQKKGLLQTLTISPWMYVGQKASQFESDPISPIVDGLERNRYGVFVGVRDRRLTLGGEWSRRTDEVESGDTPASRLVANTTGQVYSAFAIARPLEWGDPARKSPVGAIFRWDSFRPDRDADGSLRNIIAGIFWEPTKGTALALDYQQSEPRDGLAGATSETWFLHWQVAF